jgi:hypothetical protein
VTKSSSKARSAAHPRYRGRPAHRRGRAGALEVCYQGNQIAPWKPWPDGDISLVRESDKFLPSSTSAVATGATPTATRGAAPGKTITSASITASATRMPIVKFGTEPTPRRCLLCVRFQGQSRHRGDVLQCRLMTYSGSQAYHLL